MGKDDVYATMAVLIVCGTRPPSLLRGSESERLWDLLSTNVVCVPLYIHSFLIILSLPMRDPRSCFLVFLLLAMC